MKSNNQINIPQAQEAMDKFKMLICPGDGCQIRSRAGAVTAPPGRPAP